MHDEHRLTGPLQAVTDGAFTMDADPGRLRQLLTRLTSHLAHGEADALPLISQIMTQRELGQIASSVRGGTGARRAAITVPWALAGATPDVCYQVLSELPEPPVSCTGWHGCRAAPALPLRCGEHPGPGGSLRLPRRSHPYRPATAHRSRPMKEQ